jgi:transposase-like protein
MKMHTRGFVAIRFAGNNGEPFCPHCGILKVYTLTETPIRWKCAGCRRKFLVTSQTSSWLDGLRVQIASKDSQHAVYMRQVGAILRTLAFEFGDHAG